MKLGRSALCLTGAIVFLAYASLAAGFSKDYFIWDMDANGNAAPAIQSALGGAGYSGDLNANLPGLATLLEYRTVWICLGMYPNAEPLLAHPTEITTLTDYLSNNDSTCVYMEGGDAWYTDPWTSFHNYFRIKNWGHSGFGDLGTVIGQTGTFAEGMSFLYSGDNAFVDRLVIDSVSTSFYLFKNDNPEYGVMVAYDNGNCTYKTIASSCEFAGLSDGTDPSTKIALADSIMSFFCVPKTVLNYDVALIGLPAPGILTPPNQSVNTKCIIRNAGAQTASGFFAHITIQPGGYHDSTFVVSIDPDSTDTITFSAPWTAGNVGQQYNACAWANWALDQRRGNDTICKQVTAWDDRWYISSPWCSTGTSIVADGIIGAGEWGCAVRRDVSDFLGRKNQQPPGMAYLYVTNDSFNLYLALDAIFDGSNTDLDAWDMFFEDNNDGSWPAFPDSSEGEIRFENHPPPVGPWFWFRPLFSDSSRGGYWVTVRGYSNNTPGHMQFEYIIPFGPNSARGDSIHPNMWTDLCDTIGFWMTAADEGSKQIYAWWPTSSNVGFGNLSDMGMIILHCGLDRILEISVDDIISPPDPAYIGILYQVTVRVTNNGNYDESFWVYAMIGDTSNYVYFDSNYVNNLAPTASMDIDMITSWLVPAPETTWTVCAWITLDDADTTNNSTCKQLNVVPGIEEFSTRNAPRVFSLGQNTPNPFSRNTVIQFAVPRKTELSLTVFDITGSQVLTLLDDNLEPGFYRARWNGRNGRGLMVANGVYFVKMNAGDFSMTRKIVLLR